MSCWLAMQRQILFIFWYITFIHCKCIPIYATCLDKSMLFRLIVVYIRTYDIFQTFMLKNFMGFLCGFLFILLLVCSILIGIEKIDFIFIMIFLTINVTFGYKYIIVENSEVLPICPCIVQ